MIAADLLVIMPYAGNRVNTFYGPLSAAMEEFLITTPRRQAAFIAQVAHESGELRYTAEIADGSAYEGRKDLGNTQPGDGKRYKGRALLQATGRAMHERIEDELGLPVIANPELLEEPGAASRVSGWIWKIKGLNAFADNDRYGSITKLINGGYNGLDQRIAYWLKARTQLRVS